MDVIPTLNSALTGRYEVEREIGAGGMATVFLARDVRHNRRVALKVLKPELGAVLGVERFQAEIEVTANLQHPNLLPLFDSGEAGGQLFYVMPFVEGESLRVRLDREKQLPVEEAIRITVAIASALDYAHKHGVIHRDLKPENILLQSGQPMIADFGIALAVSKAGGARITQTGLSLGTPLYMSPEQATGDRAIDGRTDLYSLAAMLYEMLSGDPPHTASTSQGIIAKVLTDRPRPVRGIRSAVPVHVEAAIEHALEKLPADRFETVKDFADSLQGRGAFTAAHATTATATARPSRVSDPVFLVFGAIAVAAIAWAATRSGSSQTASDSPVVRFAVEPDSTHIPIIAGTWSVIPSPDGSSIVYTATDKGRPKLYIRKLDELYGREIPGTVTASQPIFSPDGKWLAFIADGRHKKVLVSGGTPVTLREGGANNGADWASGDRIVLGAESDKSGLAWFSAAGGELNEFTTPANKNEQHLWPIVLADGKTIAFTIWDGKGKEGSHIGITSIDGGGFTDLGVVGIAPVGVFAGHLVYVQVDGTVMAVPIDVGARKVTGSPAPVLDQIPVCPSCNGDAAIRASSSGALAYMTGATQTRLVTVDLIGGVKSLRPQLANYADPRVSPDGKNVAVSVATGTQRSIWVLNIATSTFTRTSTFGRDVAPAWSADGKQIYFVSVGGSSRGIWRQPVDGSAPAVKVLDENVTNDVAPTPDGKQLLFSSFPGTSFDIFVKTVGDSARARPWLATPAFEFSVAVSPDSKWVAYVSTESGGPEVYVRALSGEGGRVQISAGGGNEPVWSADGRKIYYRTYPSRFLIATLSTAPTIALVSRDSLELGTFAIATGAPAYSPTPDGRKFVALQADAAGVRVISVSNWLAELRAKLGKK
jgi:serine/threonine protein kinase/Tol biopolymer transport system component